MDARARLALGGAAVIAMSVSVVASVVATSAVALADAPGAGFGAHAVRLPAPAPAAAVASDAIGTIAETPVAAASTAPVAEIVPAPAPVVVAPAQTVAAAPPAAVEDEILATGSFEPVHEWATAHGWSAAEVDAWIADFTSTHKLTQGADTVAPETSDKTPQTPASAGLSDTVATTPGDGSKKDRSQGTPDPRD